ncbi:MAG: hypothetical protein U0354_07165 [Candidatus Sericytochromatia bacterium]
MDNDSSLIVSEEDRKFINARGDIPKYEFTYGEYGALLGLIMLIIVAFRETFKLLSKKDNVK